MRPFTAHAVVVNTKTVSLERIHQFRHSVAKSFRVEGDVLLNLVDSLTVGPRPVSAVETTLSPAWNYDFSNLYAAIDFDNPEWPTFDTRIWPIPPY